MKLLNFTELSEEEHLLILSFRNQDEIRKWMYNSHEISLDEHLNFIDLLKQSSDKLYFLLRDEKSKNLGVIYFSDITTDSSEFGLYSMQRGVGATLMQQIITYAKETLKITTLKCEVFKENRRAIKLYKSFGFKVYKESEGVLFMELLFDKTFQLSLPSNNV